MRFSLKTDRSKNRATGTVSVYLGKVGRDRGMRFSLKADRSGNKATGSFYLER
jgi:hypothetical protein